MDSDLNSVTDWEESCLACKAPSRRLSPPLPPQQDNDDDDDDDDDGVGDDDRDRQAEAQRNQQV